MNLDLATSAQLYTGLFEREISPHLRRLSRGIATAIDVGAAFGEYTLFFLAKTQAVKVLAFEPEQALWPKLYANLALNGLDEDPRLELFRLFLTNRTDHCSCALDSFVNLIHQPCLIKIDVDGGELDVLAGAAQLVQWPRVRWLIETHSPQLERECISYLQRAGYETQVVHNAWWRAIVPEQRPVEQNRWLFATRTNDLGDEDERL